MDIYRTQPYYIITTSLSNLYATSPASQAVYIVDEATYMAKGYMKLRERSEEKVRKKKPGELSRKG